MGEAIDDHDPKSMAIRVKGYNRRQNTLTDNHWANPLIPHLSEYIFSLFFIEVHKKAWHAEIPFG